MLAQRVATTLVAVPVILGLIAWGGVAYSLAVAAILVLASLELFAATDPDRPPPPAGRHYLWRALSPLLQQRAPALLGAAAIALLVAAAHNGADWWTGSLVLAVALTFLLLVLGNVRTGLRDWLWVAGGLVYVGFLGSHLVFLRQLDDEGQWAILAIFATFTADTAAYLFGRAFGRTHFAPNLSTGKTLEGSLAGVAGGFAAVLFLNWVTGLRADAADILPLAFLLPLAAQIGDLAESLLKRGARVKDASDLVPGHGGFLDRLDSILFTAPLVYYFVTWVIL